MKRDLWQKFKHNPETHNLPSSNLQYSRSGNLIFMKITSFRRFAKKIISFRTIFNEPFVHENTVSMHDPLSFKASYIFTFLFVYPTPTFWMQDLYVCMLVSVSERFDNDLFAVNEDVIG